jgi:hypothetical protein
MLEPSGDEALALNYLGTRVGRELLLTPSDGDWSR